MTHREDMIAKIQALSADEGKRQPAAGDWLADQDEKARLRRKGRPADDPGHDYQDGLQNAGQGE